MQLCRLWIELWVSQVLLLRRLALVEGGHAGQNGAEDKLRGGKANDSAMAVALLLLPFTLFPQSGSPPLGAPWTERSSVSSPSCLPLSARPALTRHLFLSPLTLFLLSSGSLASFSLLLWSYLFFPSSWPLNASVFSVTIWAIRSVHHTSEWKLSEPLGELN